MSAIRQGTAECIRSFQTLSTALLAHDVVFRSMINTEALEDEQGRFRVWSGNLGALQKGHSSLDYRLRDSPLLQTNVLKLLNELGANLSEALAVVSGDRLPYEQQPKPDESEDGDDVWSQDEDSGEDEAPKTELEQRFLDIVDIVDNLYKLSVRIRSPTLRSRSLKAASYRPVDPDTGIDTFEQYAVFDLQHTRELLSHLRSDSSDQKNEEDNYLIERLSKALTLRRRQFKYWRRHRDKLGTSSDIGDIRPQEVVEIGTPADKTTGDRALNVIKAPTSEWMPKSLLSDTEATQHHHSLDEVVDNKSVTSYATTTRDLTGRGIDLPSPPKAATGERDFECPYCFIICPARYGKGRAWRTHILQDLQPYVCTYKDCKDSDQLFRSRREWSEHEAGHRKLWRCPEHIYAVFRSSSSLEDHLHREHPGSFPDEQLSSIISVGETSAVDLRQACPICFVAATMEGGLQNHIANHLERLAVFALPKDVDSTEDESDGASSVASRGRIVGSRASQHLISEPVSGTESSLLSSNVHRRSSDAHSVRSGISATSSINNPKLLETVEDAIKRLTLPELAALEEQRIQQNRRKFEHISRDTPSESVPSASSRDTSRRRVSKSPSAPNVSVPKPSNSDSISRQSNNAAYLDSDLAGEQQSRWSSFNFLRRQRSSESRPHANQSASGGKMSKKQKALAQEELLRQQREMFLSAPNVFVPRPGFSDSISRQSDNATYLDSDLAPKISRLTSETRADGCGTSTLPHELGQQYDAYRYDSKETLPLSESVSRQSISSFFSKVKTSLARSRSGSQTSDKNGRDSKARRDSRSTIRSLSSKLNQHIVEPIAKLQRNGSKDSLGSETAAPKLSVSIDMATLGDELRMFDQSWIPPGQTTPLEGKYGTTKLEMLLQQKGEDFDNVLPELPELQADRQQTLPNTFDSLAKGQHTENASRSGTSPSLEDI